MVRRVQAFVREVAQKWSSDDVLAQGAALAFYMLFSLAPLLVLVIAIAGLVFGRAAVEGRVMAQLTDAVGPETARTVQSMLARVGSPGAGIVASVASLGTMLLGASGAFGHLQVVLNRIFEAPAPRGGGLWRAVRRRAAAFGMVLGIGALLGASMLLSAVVTGFGEPIADRVPVLASVLPWLDVGISLGLGAALFALLFRILPDVRVPWPATLLGGVATALLFAAGKFLIALYLGHTGGTSVFGAAASLVLLMLWIYWSAQIVFVGAEVTAVLARRRPAPG